ncbi:AMP-binding protein [Actinokineospora terrae]|uniref:Acyl-CoA synthetase (AMP-forming)/AMP-acid ligase II n=1 Tax=Actinokineospora terrae TaxID=155974 RepID=A0A1H9WIY9_9PSEU|nr:AMP-binding protein [Actinokineospora terrae]SES33791.1 Acyl-CoA synthetase (AMP-forming)/AMP-acid ligase II [Actinokineospora terrae]
MDAVSAESWWGAELLGGADDAVWAVAASPVTYATTRARVAGLARVLRAQGIGQDNTVALHGTASLTQLWALFALWSLGAQVLHVDPGVPERAELLARHRPQFQVVIGSGPRAPGRFVDECGVLVGRLPGGRSAVSEHCLVQFTPGRLAAVGRSPESLLSEVDRLALVAPGDAVLVATRLTRFAGLAFTLHTMAAGGSLVFTPATGVDVVLGEPAAFAALVDAEVRLGVRLAVSAGGVLSQSVYDDFAARYGVLVGQAYGTAETGFVATDARGRLGPGSLGVPLPGVRTRVINGVLEVHLARSPYPFTHTNWRGGWLSTLDAVHIDHSGALALGRLAERDALSA